MVQNEYLKIKEKYEAVLFELMKEVSKQLDYEDCNCLYRDWALTLVSASIDFEKHKSDIWEDLAKFQYFMIGSIGDTKDQIDKGIFNGKVIKHYD